MKAELRYMVAILTMFATLCLCSPLYQNDSDIPLEKAELQAGEIFEPNTFVTVGDVEVLYNGKTFEVTNNGDKTVSISATVVGLKADNTYDEFYWPAFHGVDKKRYDNDLEENGWALEWPTNEVGPSETLDMTLEIYETEWLKPDVDGDGYYDIFFSIHSIEPDGAFQISTDDPKSDVYKLKAD